MNEVASLQDLRAHWILWMKMWITRSVADRVTTSQLDDRFLEPRVGQHSTLHNYEDSKQANLSRSGRSTNAFSFPAPHIQKLGLDSPWHHLASPPFLHPPLDFAAAASLGLTKHQTSKQKMLFFSCFQLTSKVFSKAWPWRVIYYCNHNDRGPLTQMKW